MSKSNIYFIPLLPSHVDAVSLCRWLFGDDPEEGGQPAAWGATAATDSRNAGGSRDDVVLPSGGAMPMQDELQWATWLA